MKTKEHFRGGLGVSKRKYKYTNCKTETNNKFLDVL